MAIEWPLVLFSLLAGCGGCTFAYIALADLLKCGKPARFNITVVALIITVIGGFCSVAHLASPQNVMAAVWNIGSFSGISVELILIGITCILMIAYLVMVRREASENATLVVGVIGGVFGLLLAFFTGHGYVLESQLAWDTEFLPLAYLGTSLALGAFVYAVCAAAMKVAAPELEKMAVSEGAGAIIGALTIVAYVAAVGLGAGAENPLVVWVGLIACGVVVTAVCGVMLLVRRALASSLALPCAGLAAAAIGALSLRAFMWIMGSGYLSLFDICTGPRVIFGF